MWLWKIKKYYVQKCENENNALGNHFKLQFWLQLCMLDTLFFSPQRSVHRQVLALMGDEPWAFILFCLYSLSLISFNLFQKTFINRLSFSSKSFYSHLSCPCCMSLIFSQAQVRRATYVVGNMKEVTFKSKGSTTAQWHRCYKLHSIRSKQCPVKGSKCPARIHKQHVFTRNLGLTQMFTTIKNRAFCSQEHLYNKLWDD